MSDEKETWSDDNGTYITYYDEAGPQEPPFVIVLSSSPMHVSPSSSFRWDNDVR